MKRNSQAKIISCNKNNVEICASAARISTTKGNSVEIFEKAANNTKNQELINKVLIQKDSLPGKIMKFHFPKMIK